MSTFTRSAFLPTLAMLTLVGCGDRVETAAETRSWDEAFPTFTRHQIAELEEGSYGTVFDVDGDGMRDAVAFSGVGSELVWFKNPNWERHAITTDTERFIHMAPHDIDGDGDTDLALASEFDLGNSTGGGTIYWLENPEDPALNEQWNLHPIDAVPASHRLRWADVDGDGARELLNLPIVGIGAVAPEYVGASQLKAYWVPADPTGPWPMQILDDRHLEVAHGIVVVDWDGDDADDILTADNDGVMLFRPARGGEPQHIGAGHDAGRPNRGSSEVGLGTLGGERFIATIDPWHGTDAVVYTPGDSEGGIWNREVIGTEFEGGHGLMTGDFNGDGYDEIVAGGRGGGGSVIIYRYRPDSGSWERIPLDIGGMALSGIDVSDIDGDGDLDILAVGRATANVVWYENS